MSPLETFCWGFTGSVAVELVTILGFYTTPPYRLPTRYRRVGFWITRFLVCFVAGGVAVGYDIHQRILAFNIGAATPLIISLMARGLRPGPTASAVLMPLDRRRPVLPAQTEPTEHDVVEPAGRGPSSRPS